MKGAAQEILSESFTPNSSGVYPAEFHGIKPRLDVKPGDSVKVGTPLFHDKKLPEIRFGSPASGKITDIQYGPARRVDRITISRAGDDFEQHPNYRPSEIASLKREALIDHLLSGCVWPYIRQRPFDRVANPHETPSSIFINCMDTAPLANNPEFSLKDKIPEFRAGIEALKILSGRVHVVVSAGKKESVFANVEGVELHAFSGKHPAGLVGTHISRIDPIRHGKTVWYLNARDVTMIGSFLLVGQYPTERIVAVAGSGSTEKKYFRTSLGASIGAYVQNDSSREELRIISGNLLTGRAIQPDSFPGFYDDLITILPEGRERHFLGWLLPGLNAPSFSRAFLSSLFPGRKYAMNTNLNGGQRAFVKSGDYERVVGLEIYPAFLAKAILSEDIDTMEALGILECAPEDFALCSYICPSKIEFAEIIQNGLDMMEAEIG